MKNLLTVLVCLFAVSALPVKAASPVYPVSALLVSAAVVIGKDMANSDPSALQKCETTKKAENGNYSYTVYTKEACKK